MIFSTFLAVLVVVCSTVRSMSEPKACCTQGRKRGLLILANDKYKTCDPEASLTAADNEFSKLLCVGIFRSCCRIAASSHFCLVGVQLAMANQECRDNKLIGGTEQKTCCNCCKAGRGHGKAGNSCAKIPVAGANDTCRAAFKDCCTKSKVTEPEKSTCKTVTCLTNQYCVQNTERAICQCNAGYREIGGACVDINPCVQVTCTTHSYCSNTQGTSQCICSTGYDMKDKKCVPKSKSCSHGYELQNGKCQDIDECTSGVHRCPFHSYCLNREGSYRCLIRCFFPNFQTIKGRGAQAAGICADVDECAKKTNKCVKNYKCVNTIGSYDCKRVSCDEGYKFVNGYCEDVDECSLNSDICGKKGVCRNAFGSYYCGCPPGYDIDQETGKCVDVDECKLNNNCRYKCNNTEGSYRCYCPHGYTIRNRFCYDIDECKTNPCPSSTHCFNTYGGYQCIKEPCDNQFYVQRSFNKCQKKSCTIVGDRCTSMASSIKWQAFRMTRDSPPKWFQFGYTLTGFNPSVNFHFALVEGNEEHVFDIRKTGRGKVSVYNAKTLKASKEYRLKMFSDVRIGSKLYDRYVYIFYIYVSPYNF